MRTLTLTLNHLPWPELTANARRREHWTIVHRVTCEAKEEVGWLAQAGILKANQEGLEWGDKPMLRARISYEFHVKDHRVHDLDNWLAACKPIPDALIEVNVLTYDNARHLEIGGLKLVQDTEEKTVIVVEEIEASNQ